MKEAYVVDIDSVDEKTQMDTLKKIHAQFGHRPKKAFVDLLKVTNKWRDSFSGMLDKIIDGCEGCIMRKRNPDRPAVAMPLANDFNEVVPWI